jgi:hypothetical protein
MPVEEFVSPDGRAVIAAKAIPLGGDTYRYEYAIMNVDMDAQIGAFAVPIDGRMNARDAGFYAVPHHGEPVNTAAPDAVPIANEDWAISIDADAVRWETTDGGDGAFNPIRWGTTYNFWFTADADPVLDAAAITPFRQSVYPFGGLAAATIVPLRTPASCDGDADGNLVVDVNDLTRVVRALGNTGGPEDVDGSGTVDVNDITYIVGRLGNEC